jgi:hypothetical protein
MGSHFPLYRKAVRNSYPDSNCIYLYVDRVLLLMREPNRQGAHLLTRSSKNQPSCGPAEVAVTSSKVESKVKKLVIDTAFEELLKAKETNDGICGYGEYTKTSNKFHVIGHSWLNCCHLTYLREGYNLSRNKESVQTAGNSNGTSAITNNANQGMMMMITSRIMTMITLRMIL